jgi:hypothetical protein
MYKKALIFLLLLTYRMIGAQTPVLRIDSTLDAPFFHTEQTCFPKWVIHGKKKGELINAQTKKKIKSRDSISLKTTASSLMIRYSNQEDGIFPDTIVSVESRAFLSGDTLNLLCAYQSTPSDDVLYIALAPVIRASIVEGAPKKKEIVGERVVFRHVTLNQEKYKKGEWVRAQLDFGIEYDLNDVARGPYHQKVYYQGWMKCRVE